jgi:predicted O-methyltransferase YrrM
LEENLAGIDLTSDSQYETLLRIIQLYPDFDWTLEKRPDRRFYLHQGYFKEADSIVLFALMRLFSPKRVTEIGSGFSSALMLDVSDRFVSGQIQFTFIDPFPERLREILRPGDLGKARIITQEVQDVPLNVFEELEANDILFIDSSHVSKMGSDVNYLCFEVLPRLARGVIVHVHDIFWPFEYPIDWVREGRAWNEAYLLRAFLSFNTNFEIFFWVPYAPKKWRDLIATKMPDYMKDTGASLWLRRAK